MNETFDPTRAAARARIADGAAVLVTGATGFIGSALTRALVSEGRQVIVFSRDVPKASRMFGPAVRVVGKLDDVQPETRIDAIIHLAGAPVMGPPWTRRRRELLVHSRIGITRQLIALIWRLHDRPRVLVAASAVGFYGVPGNMQTVDEQAHPQAGRFQSDLCATVEDAARQAEATGTRVVRLRFGIVLGTGGGAFPGLAFAARLGLGSRLGSGQQPVPWIHLDDAVGLLRFALDDQTLSGAVNAVSPDTPTQAEFANVMAQAAGRRVRLVVPGCLLRRMLGEMSELLLCGQRALPAAAGQAGFRWKFPTLNAAIDALLHRGE